MDDGRQGPDKKKPARPSWAERSVPEQRSAPPPGRPTGPLSTEDLGDLVPASDPVVRQAYGRSGALPMRPNVNRGEGTDALVIRRGARETRVLSFEVEGVHWRAGFAPGIDKTPLYQYLPSAIPPDQELKTGNGFVMRPVESELESVLRDLVPPALLMTGDRMFGEVRDLGGVYLYFIPHGQGASVGLLAWYVPSPTAKQHLLYLQTEVRKADDRLVEEMHKTFRASLSARAEHGPSRRALDLWGELRLASAQVEATLKTSSLTRNSAEAAHKLESARQTAEARAYNAVNSGLDTAARLCEQLFVKLPQQLAVAAVRTGTGAIVGVIRWLDRLMAPKS